MGYVVWHMQSPFLAEIHPKRRQSRNHYSNGSVWEEPEIILMESDVRFICYLSEGKHMKRPTITANSQRLCDLLSIGSQIIVFSPYLRPEWLCHQIARHQNLHLIEDELKYFDLLYSSLLRLTRRFRSHRWEEP